MAKVDPKLLEAINNDQDAFMQDNNPTLSMSPEGTGNPKIDWIVAFLYKEPIFAEAVHAFIQEKRAIIEKQKLLALYSKPKLVQMLTAQGLDEAAIERFFNS